MPVFPRILSQKVATPEPCNEGDVADISADCGMSTEQASFWELYPNSFWVEEVTVDGCRDGTGRLQNQALLAALSTLSGQESGAGCGFEDFTDTLVGLCGAFEILVGTNLLSDLLTLNLVSNQNLQMVGL